jgi:hypothetical protein
VRAQANAEPRPGCFCPKGLVLTEDGAASPQTDSRRSQGSEMSRAQQTGREKRPVKRKRWKPDGRDYGLGSRQPDPQDASLYQAHTILSGLSRVI